MKTKFIIFAAAFAALASCTKEPSIVENQTPDGKQMSFTVVAEDTKTVLADQKKTYWSGLESISIFDGTSNNRFTAELATASPSATFSGNAAEVDSYVALYPYNESARLTGNVISTAISASQTALKDTFDPSSAVLVGAGKGSISLTNVCSLLKITVPEGVTSIEVEGNGTAIAGNVSIDLANGNAVSGATETKVTLAKSDNSVFEKGAYYIAVAPGTLNGVTVTLRDAVNKKHMTRKVDGSRTLKGNVIYDMGEFGVVTDVKYLFVDDFCSEAFIYSTATLSVSTESPASGTNCLKWVFDHDGTWNVATIAFNNLDLKNVSNAENAYLVYKFRVGVDNGPSTGWEIFRTYFNTSVNNFNVQIGKRTVGRTSAEGGAEQFDYIVKDNNWHELRISLADAINNLKTNEASTTALSFSDMGNEYNYQGTTIYFDDIRLEGCGFEVATDVWVDDVTPEPEPEPEDVFYLFDDAWVGTWSPWDPNSGLSISDEQAASGTKSVKWVYQAQDYNGWNVHFVMDLRSLNIDWKSITDPSKAFLKYKVKMTVDNAPSGWYLYENTFMMDGINDIAKYQISRASNPNDVGEWRVRLNADWIELSIPLEEAINKVKEGTAFIGPRFRSAETEADGTTLYFDDIRLVGCGLNK